MVAIGDPEWHHFLQPRVNTCFHSKRRDKLFVYILSQVFHLVRQSMNILPNQKLLTKLVDSVDASPFVLICDHLGSDSIQLVKTLISNRLKHVSVNSIFVETDPQVFSETFVYPIDKNSKTELKIRDLFCEYYKIESDLCHHLVESLTDTSDDSVVFIDSLTPFLAVDSLYEISRLLTQLYNRFRQLVCVLHVDCHSQYVCESIEHLSHSAIHLTKVLDKNDNHFKAIIRHRKPHRKTHFSIKESMELFRISEHKIDYIKQNESTKRESIPSHTTSDSTMNLPFNLNLKESELEAKNSLVLPYIKWVLYCFYSIYTTIVWFRAADNDSKVFYEYDKNDDIDEEDPDDDLDIWGATNPHLFIPWDLLRFSLSNHFSLWISSYFWSDNSRVDLSFDSSFKYF